MDDGWGKDSQLDTILRLKDLHPQEDDIFSPWPGGSSIQPIGSKDFAFGHRSIYQNTGVFPFVKAFASPTQSPASVSPSSPASISPPTATVVDNTAADLFNAAYRFLDSDNVRTNGLNLPGQVDADLFSVDFVSDEDMRGELDFDMEGEKSPRFSANTAAPQQPVYQIQKPPSPAPQQPFRPYAMNMNMLRKTNTMPEVPVVPDIANDVVTKQASHSPIVAPPPTQHPNGEHPSRTLFVRNINSNVDDEELRTIFEQFGPIRSMYTQCKHRGFVMISYYDIRHAKNAMKNLQSKILRRRRLDIHFSIPKDNPSEKDQNQGTLVVFNLDPSIGNRELRLIFGQYGEIKEIRETPHKKHHKFIEFFDVRDAERAMEMLNKTEIKSKKIKIEPSRPGGLRRQATEEPITASAPAAMQTIPTHTASEGNFNCRIASSNTRSATDLGSTASSSSSSSSNSPHLATRSYSLNDSFVPGAEFDQESRLLNWSIDSDFDKSVDGGDWKINSSFGALPVNGNSANTNISGSNNSFYSSSNNSSSSSLNHTIGAMSKNSTNNVNNLGHSIANNILSPVNSTNNTNNNLISSNNSNNDKINNMNNSNLNMTINIEAVLNGSDDRTTLMIRNIPNKYTQRMLLTNIDEHHRKLYDFFYLPIDFKNKCNFGYAFINFITSEGIVDFYEKFHNKKWEKFNSEKVCQIMWARIQGKSNLIANFQNSSLMCEDKKCRPVIFHSSGPLAGQLAPFPFVSSPHNRRSKGQPLSPRSQQAQLSPRSQQQLQQQSPQQPQSPQSQQTSPSQSPYSSMGYSPQASPRSGNPNNMGNSASNISLNMTNLGTGYQQPISPPTSHHVSPRHLGTSSLSPRHISQSMYQSPFQSFPTFAPTFSAAQTPYADWS